MDNNSFHSLKDLIQEYINKNNMQEYVLVENIKNDWHIITGNFASKKIKVLSLKNGILRLKTNSSVWRNELILRKTEFINKINLHYKNEVIKDITFY